MGRTVCYFAGPQDNRALCEYAQSIGLKILPMLAEKPEITPQDDPAECPACYLTYVPNADLHPYGNPPVISEATDPLLFLYRSYYKAPYLVMGQLHCSNDVPEFFQLTKPYFARLVKWIGKNWSSLRKGEFIGPEAQRLVDCGAKLTSLPPDVSLQIEISDKKGDKKGGRV